MAKIHKTSEEVKSAILRKSAYSLPNNPTDSGFKANDIRNAFYKPIIDTANSALTEIDRIVGELNGVLGIATKDVDAIASIVGSYYHGSDGLIYSFNGSAFTVSGNNELKGEVVIPSSVFYQGKYYPVVAIAANAFSGSKITKAEIPSSVEEIGEKAFYTKTLTSAKFYGKTKIGNEAFYTEAIEFCVPNEYFSDYESSLASYKKTLKGFDTVASVAGILKEKADAANSGASIACTMGETDYKMTVSLKNADGKVISSAEVDLPLESMILGAKYAEGILSLNIKTADDSMNNAVVDVNISDLISGLVNSKDFEVQTNRLVAVENEVEQKQLYAYVAYSAEEAEYARGYTKGGKIDLALKNIDKRLKTIENNLKQGD